MSSSRKILGVDTVILNANVITVDQEWPRAEALAISDGKFVAVGTTIYRCGSLWSQALK